MHKRLVEGLKKLITMFLIWVSNYRKELVATCWYNNHIINIRELMSPVLLRRYELNPLLAHHKRNGAIDDVMENCWIETQTIILPSVQLGEGASLAPRLWSPGLFQKARLSSETRPS